VNRKSKVRLNRWVGTLARIGRTVNWVSPIAFYAALIGGVQCWLGWTIAGSLWNGYDPVRETISDLAANESPVKYIMSAFFLLGGTLSIIGGIFTPAFALPGRIAIVLSGIATYGLTIFPTPLIGYSTPHRVFAITSFVLSSAWPLLAMRLKPEYPAFLRPLVSILVTLGFAVFSIYFLRVWTDPNFKFVGVVERALAVAQSWYLVGSIIALYVLQRRAKDGALPESVGE